MLSVFPSKQWRLHLQVLHSLLVNHRSLPHPTKTNHEFVNHTNALFRMCRKHMVTGDLNLTTQHNIFTMSPFAPEAPGGPCRFEKGEKGE